MDETEACESSQFDLRKVRVHIADVSLDYLIFFDRGHGQVFSPFYWALFITLLWLLHFHPIIHMTLTTNLLFHLEKFYHLPWTRPVISVTGILQVVICETTHISSVHVERVVFKILTIICQEPTFSASWNCFNTGLAKEHLAANIVGHWCLAKS